MMKITFNTAHGKFNMEYTKALQECIDWIKENYKPISIIVSGSIIRGNPDQNSDYDIYVVHNKSFRKRILKVFKGIECDIFINNKEHIIKYIKEEYTKNRPSTAHMITTGNIIFGASEIVDIYKLSEEYVNKPLVLTKTKKSIKEYYLKTLLDDIEDIKEKKPEGCSYIINKIAEELLDYNYILEKKTLPRLKERLENIENEQAKKLFYELYMASSNKDKIKIIKELFVVQNIPLSSID